MIDIDYLRARAKEERERAEMASDTCARSAHLRMAREYDSRAVTLEQAQAEDLHLGGPTSTRAA